MNLRSVLPTEPGRLFLAKRWPGFARLDVAD